MGSCRFRTEECVEKPEASADKCLEVRVKLAQAWDWGRIRKCSKIGCDAVENPVKMLKTLSCTL